MPDTSNEHHFTQPRALMLGLLGFLADVAPEPPTPSGIDSTEVAEEFEGMVCEGNNNTAEVHMTEYSFLTEECRVDLDRAILTSI